MKVRSIESFVAETRFRETQKKMTNSSDRKIFIVMHLVGIQLRELHIRWLIEARARARH